jgi:hypothetical protein
MIERLGLTQPIEDKSVCPVGHMKANLAEVPITSPEEFEGEWALRVEQENRTPVILEAVRGFCLACQEQKELREALPDPDKLENLAYWIDVKYPDDKDPQVQRDLRKWASTARQALEMKK